MDILRPIGVPPQPAILGNECHAKVTSRRIQHPVRWITRECRAIKLARPCGRLGRQRGGHRTPVSHHHRDPAPDGSIQLDPTVTYKQPDLPPRDRADEDLFRPIDGRIGGRR
jgi:hypothetical protein